MRSYACGQGWGEGRKAAEIYLITGTNVLGGAANVHTLGNVWGLLLDGNNDVASLVVEACTRGKSGSFAH
jgi:hypothetical protein